MATEDETGQATFAETMLFPVAVRDGQARPFVHQQLLLAFTSADAAEAFFAAVGRPPGVQLAREEGWHRVTAVLRQAAAAGARRVAVDPDGPQIEAGPLDLIIERLTARLQARAGAPAHRLIAVMERLHRHRRGAPAPRMPSAAAVFSALLAEVLEAWDAPSRVRQTAPLAETTFASLARQVDFDAAGETDGRLFVHDWLDELSIWAERELAARGG